MDADAFKRLAAAQMHDQDGAKAPVEDNERLDILATFWVSDDEMTVVHTDVSKDLKTCVLDWNGDVELMLSVDDVEAMVSCLSRSLKIMKGGAS